MKYYPEPVPYTDDLPYIREWLGREFSNILVAFEGVEMIQLVEDHITPTDPRTGMIKFADGVDWNPGGGMGFYGYNGTSWVKLDDTSLSTGVIQGTWTPALTFTTMGDLAVTYAAQIGRYQKVGKRVHLHGFIQTSAFTWTTAAGELRITGLPFAALGSGVGDSTGSAEIQTITFPAGRTQINSNIPQGVSYVRFVVCGSAVTRSAIAASNTTSGTTLVIIFDIMYETA